MEMFTSFAGGPGGVDEDCSLRLLRLHEADGGRAAATGTQFHRNNFIQVLAKQIT